MNREQTKAAKEISVELFVLMEILIHADCDLNTWGILDDILRLVKTGMIASGQTPDAAEEFCLAAFTVVEQLSEIICDTSGKRVTREACFRALSYQWHPAKRVRVDRSTDPEEAVSTEPNQLASHSRRPGNPETALFSDISPWSKQATMIISVTNNTSLDDAS